MRVRCVAHRPGEMAGGAVIGYRLGRLAQPVRGMVVRFDWWRRAVLVDRQVAGNQRAGRGEKHRGGSHPRKERRPDTSGVAAHPLTIIHGMNRLGALVILVILGTAPAAQQDPVDSYRDAASRLIAESQATDFGWNRLAELTDTFGHRLSGSQNLERAIEWALAEMKQDGFETRREPVMVPVWIRGDERLDMIRPAQQPVAMLGLGGSIGTPDAGIEAPVLVAKSFEDLKTNALRAKGRIVLYNVPFTSYGQTV